ncbi:Palmitoyltransferase zdhhc7 [Desmophyllum pertusum]|uniref:Palmitoyltransferase zdhhc7 n=1 Tax=Desmophyllum pertusum TaxID=174260 RepID=A0A9X0CF95_9CNID|nr:Palmitoyltransferase zdhhc7 [Desmophyllum pertusum]
MGRKTNCCGLSWFINDGVGIGCAVFTYLLIGYAEFVVVFVMLLPEIVTAAAFGWFHAIAFTLLSCLALVAHSRAMCSNPGNYPLRKLYIRKFEEATVKRRRSSSKVHQMRVY